VSTYYGQAGNISGLVQISNADIQSSSNTSPIVITTATPHGLQTGQCVIINNHLVNITANGVWVAVVLTGTTYQLFLFSGVASTPTAAGGATGSSQPIGIPGITLPEDFTVDRDAASVNVPLEALADMVAWLTYRTFARLQILPGGDASINGARFSMAIGARNNVSHVELADANHTIDAGFDGPEYVLSKPTAVRTITIKQATDTGKYEDDTLTFWMPVPPDDPSAAYYQIRREGSVNNIAILWGKYTPSAGAGEAYPGFCRVYLKSSVWRLLGGAGINFDTDA
jgi:hypothetical protein